MSTTSILSLPFVPSRMHEPVAANEGLCDVHRELGSSATREVGRDMISYLAAEADSDSNEDRAPEGQQYAIDHAAVVETTIFCALPAFTKLETKKVNDEK